MIKLEVVQHLQKHNHHYWANVLLFSPKILSDSSTKAFSNKQKHWYRYYLKWTTENSMKQDAICQKVLLKWKCHNVLDEFYQKDSLCVYLHRRNTVIISGGGILMVLAGTDRVAPLDMITIFRNFSAGTDAYVFIRDAI